MTPLIDGKRNEIVDLCRRYRVRAIELFSSAVNDRFDPATSDIDFLVDYEALGQRSTQHATSAYCFPYKTFLGERLTWWNCPRFATRTFCRLLHRIGYCSMHFEALKYLYDMEQACVLLSSFLVGKTFADYEADPMLRSAVERQLMIVGEALNRLRKIEPELLASITDSRKIIAFRNILVHGYDIIRNEVVWGMLDSDLSTLTVEVSALLQQGQAQQGSIEGH